jgi:hypothetical protein
VQRHLSEIYVTRIFFGIRRKTWKLIVRTAHESRHILRNIKTLSVVCYVFFSSKDGLVVHSAEIPTSQAMVGPMVL